MVRIFKLKLESTKLKTQTQFQKDQTQLKLKTQYLQTQNSVFPNSKLEKQPNSKLNFSKLKPQFSKLRTQNSIEFDPALLGTVLHTELAPVEDQHSTRSCVSEAFQDKWRPPANSAAPKTLNTRSSQTMVASICVRLRCAQELPNRFSHLPVQTDFS